MTDDIIQHLVDRISTVSALAGSTGTTMGGTEADPTLTTVPMPVAWVVLQSAQDDAGKDGKTAADSKYQRLLLTFSVFLVQEYGEGDDEQGLKLKMIDDVAAAVRGTQALSFGCDPWAYQGCQLAFIQTNRIAYELFFQVRAYNKSTS